MLSGDGIHYLVETKGLEDTNVANKDRAAQLWCENTTRLAGKPWAYLKILQTKYKQLQLNRFDDLFVLEPSVCLPPFPSPPLAGRRGRKRRDAQRARCKTALHRPPPGVNAVAAPIAFHSIKRPRTLTGRPLSSSPLGETPSDRPTP